MVQLSTDMQLIKAVCTALSTKSNVSNSQHKTQKRTIVTTFYGRSQQRDCVCQWSCTSSPSAEDFFSERISHFARCTEHLAQTLTSSHAWPSDIVCTAALCCSSSSCRSSFSPFSAFSLRSNTRLFLCFSCHSLWTGRDLVPMSARFSADVHAPTMTTPRFTNCCSQRTFVDGCRMVPTPSRLHMPRAAALSSKSSVRSSGPMSNKTSRINIVSLVADAA